MQKSGITSRNSSRLWPWVTSAGLILIAIGVLMPILGIGGPAFKWVYGAGAVVSLIGRIMTPYKGDILRVKRLHRIEAWSSIFYSLCSIPEQEHRTGLHSRLPEAASCSILQS